MKTEIAPLVIMTKLEQYDYAGATAIAVMSGPFLLLGAVNLLRVERPPRGARDRMPRRPTSPPLRRPDIVAPVLGLFLVLPLGWCSARAGKGPSLPGPPGPAALAREATLLTA
jgi:hypothetical protein